MRISMSKLSVAMLALPILASATVLPRTGGTGAACGTTTSGQAQCCSSTQNPAAGPLTGLLGVLVGLLGIDVGAVTGLVALTCSPLSVIGVGGTNCNSQAVCCTNNTFNGLINLGCSPLNVGL